MISALFVLQSRLFEAVDTVSSLTIWVPATAVLAGTLAGSLVGFLNKHKETQVSADAQLISGQLSYIGQVTGDNRQLRTEMQAMRSEHAAEMEGLRRQHMEEVAALRAELWQVRHEAGQTRERLGKVEKEVDGYS